MITFLQGTLAEKSPTRAVMDVQGVGYEVTIPLSSYDRLPAVNARCRVLTHFHVREDAQELYGFATEDERELFRLLTDIGSIIGGAPGRVRHSDVGRLLEREAGRRAVGFRENLAHPRLEGRNMLPQGL